MEEPLSDKVFAGAAARAAALQRLQQRAAVPAATLAETQALLAESLAQQGAWLQELQQAAPPGPPTEPELAATNDHYRALFNAIDEGFCLLEIVYDAQGAAVDSRVLAVNPAYEQLTGLANATGRLTSELAPGTEAPWLAAHAEVVRTGQTQRFQHYHQPTGRWYEARVARVGGAGSRQVGIVFTEITARKQAEKALQESEARHSFLLQLSDALGPLTDALAIQGAVTRVIQDFFQADRCYYGEIANGQCIIRHDAAAAGLPSVAGVYELRTLPFFGAVVAAGRPVVVENAPTSALLDESLRQLYGQLQVVAFLAVPVIKNGQPRGILCVVQGTPRAWTPLEVALTQDTAERTWAAVERGHTKAALHASEARLRIALEAAKLGTWDWNLATNEVYWNARHFTQFGLEPQPGPVTPSLFEDHVHPKDRAEVRQQLRTAIAEQQVFEAEFRIITAQGALRWMSGYGQTTGVDADGRCQRMSGVMLDITARKQAEQQLQLLAASLERQVTRRTQALLQSRDLLQSVYDTSLIGLAVVQAKRDATGAVTDFTFVSVNRHFEQATGRTNLVGKRYSQEFPTLETSNLLARMRQVLATGLPQQLEYPYPYQDELRWYSSMFVKLDDGVVITSLDITERKQAETTRDQQFTLLEQAEGMAQLGSWEYEPATGAFHWSAGMYHLFGLPEGTPIEPGIYLDYVLPDDRPAAERLVHRIRQAPHDFEETLRLRLRVGSEVKTVRIRAVVVPGSPGQPPHVLGVDLDLSEVRRLEADNLRLRLEQQQALFEAVQQAQEEEKRRMSESLHNGIGQILYATRLQLDRLPPTPASLEAGRLLSEAMQQARALSHELSPALLEDFGLEAALLSLCRTLSIPTLHWHCHLVLEENPTPLPPTLQLAVYRLAQELTQNVGKHAQATEATLEVEVLPAWVVLRVEDNGRGFDATQASTGLGWRTLRNRVALLGGSTHLSTAPGQGTQCQVRLPLFPVRP